MCAACGVVSSRSDPPWAIPQALSGRSDHDPGRTSQASSLTKRSVSQWASYPPIRFRGRVTRVRGRARAIFARPLGVRRVGHRPRTGWGHCERTLMSQSVAVASPVEGGKRGELFGGALTEEALDSSRSVLGAHRGGGLRGLQQFYTPPEAAGFIREAIDPLGRSSVLDPTAGNGALLAPWPREQRFGVEIDGDQVRAGEYQAI